MPAAAVYFRDPDGHQLEYLTMLDEPPARTSESSRGRTGTGDTTIFSPETEPL